MPGVTEALRRLQEAGFLLIMITNQSGVGRGLFSMADVERVHEHLFNQLARDKVSIRKIYVAPEAPEQPMTAPRMKRRGSLPFIVGAG